MFSTLFTVALFVAPAIQGALANFAINSPTLVQCQKAQISWEPTKGPYNLIVVKASDPCGDPLVDLGDFNKTAITWTANIPAGTEVQLSLLDAEDNEAWSKTLTVGTSSDASCLHGASSAVSTPAATPVPSPAASTPSDPAGDATPSDVDPVGAANAGSNPFSNGAINARQASTPLLAIAGLAAVLALL